VEHFVTHNRSFVFNRFLAFVALILVYNLDAIFTVRLVVAFFILTNQLLSTLEAFKMMGVIISSTSLVIISIDLSFTNRAEWLAIRAVTFIAVESNFSVIALRMVGSLTLKRLSADNASEMI